MQGLSQDEAPTSRRRLARFPPLARHHFTTIDFAMFLPHFLAGGCGQFCAGTRLERGCDGVGNSCLSSPNIVHLLSRRLAGLFRTSCSPMRSGLRLLIVGAAVAPGRRVAVGAKPRALGRAYDRRRRRVRRGGDPNDRTPAHPRKPAVRPSRRCGGRQGVDRRRDRDSPGELKLRSADLRAKRAFPPAMSGETP